MLDRRPMRNTPRQVSFASEKIVQVIDQGGETGGDVMRDEVNMP